MTPLPNRKLANWHLDIILQARVQGGGKGPTPPPPPLEIEKQKKGSSEQILSYFIYILLLI